MIGTLDTEQTLLLLKIGFLALLYLFIWAVVRSVTRDLRSVPQESIILSATEANELRARYEPVVPMPAGTFVTHFGKQIHWDGAKDEDAILLAESREQAGILGSANQIEAVRSAMEGREPKFTD